MFGRKNGRYAEQKQKKTDRDVISYEDVPLDDYEQEKTDMSPGAVKKIIISVCIVFVAGLIVFAFANRDKLTWDNISTWWTYDVLGNAGNGYPVDLVGSEVTADNFAVSQGHVAYVSDVSFVTLNSTASEIANYQISYSTPVLKSSGNRFLTYGLGGTCFEVYDFDSKLYTGETDEDIYTGDISDNGIYCIVTEGNGYLTTLFVYDENNNRIYKYYFSEYYITSVALNSDGSGCVAAGITSSDGAKTSGVYVLDFSSEDPESFYCIDDEAILDCKYLNNSKIALVGQTASYLITVGSESYTTNDYGDKTLANYCFNPDTNAYTLALSRSGDGRSCTLVQYNSNGEQVCSIDTEYKSESLSMYKNTMALLDGNTVYLYNTDGQLTYSGDTGTGSKSLILTSNSSLYLLSVNQVRYFDLGASSSETRQTSEETQ